MATDGPVMRFNNVQYAGKDERLMFATVLGALGGGPFSARSGKRPGTGLNATVSGLNVTVGPGPGVIYDATYSSAGPYLFANLANRVVPLGDGVGVRPGTGQKRIDLIVAKITDPDTIGGVAEMKIVRVAGEAAPTPTAPELPSLSLEVARAEVPASGSVVLTLSSPRTVAAGGILPVATTTERDLLPSPHAGLAVYVEADDSLYVKGPGTGPSTWKKYSYEKSGTMSISSTFTPAAGRVPRWTQQGSLVFLAGSAVYDPGVLPASGSILLGGLPAVAVRWDGVLRTGNSGLFYAALGTDGRVTWDARQGSASAFIALDGIYYTTSA